MKLNPYDTMLQAGKNKAKKMMKAKVGRTPMVKKVAMAQGPNSPYFKQMAARHGTTTLPNGKTVVKSTPASRMEHAKTMRKTYGNSFKGFTVPKVATQNDASASFQPDLSDSDEPSKIPADSALSEDTARPTKVVKTKPMKLVSKPFSGPKRELAANINTKTHLQEAQKAKMPKVASSEIYAEYDGDVEYLTVDEIEKVARFLTKKELLAFARNSYKAKHEGQEKKAGNFEPAYIERFGTMEQKLAMKAKGLLGKDATIKKQLLMNITQVGPKSPKPGALDRLKGMFRSKPRQKTPSELMDELKANPDKKLNPMTE